MMKYFYRYDTWLIIISVLVLIAERIKPWRQSQLVLRPQLFQDLFWFVFNGFLLSSFLSPLIKPLYGGLDKLYLALQGILPKTLQIAQCWPLWLQVIVFLVVADFLEWSVHNSLHRVGFLWKFHRLHHSIKHMDWIGNFRFHWGEVLWYKTCKYLPLTLLGASWQAMLIVAVFATCMGHLNHANLAISWGPLRYIFNSPRMHLWHHEKKVRGKAGTNFGVVLSVWDWLFGTAYFPKDNSVPEDIGFFGEQKFSQGIFKRFFMPLS